MLWVCLFTPDTGYIYHTQQCLVLLARLSRDGDVDCHEVINQI